MVEEYNVNLENYELPQICFNSAATEGLVLFDYNIKPSTKDSPKKDPKGILIRNAGFSTKLTKLLERNLGERKRLESLTSITPEEILLQRGFGLRQLGELRQSLSDYGLYLKGDKS